MQRQYGAALCLALALGGCVTAPPASYVAAGTPRDNQVIATAICRYLSRALPPGRTTLVIEPATAGDPALLGLLGADLRARGFGVAEPTSGAINAVPVRLRLTSDWGGYVARVDYGSQEVGTFFGRDISGNLQASSPFVRREL